MRDDALFRTKGKFPFSSETSTLVGSPGAQARFLGDSHLSLRDQLSDAAYLGAFDRMFSILAKAERTIDNRGLMLHA